MITVEKKSDGSVVTTSVTTDKDGNFLKKEVKTEKTSKKGTQSTVTVTDLADGTNIKKTEYKYKSGKTSVSELTKNPDKSTKYTNDVKNADGSTSSTVKTKDSDGNIKYHNETVDAEGNITVTDKKTNIDGSITTLKTKTSTSGKTTAKLTEISADGVKVVTKFKTISKGTGNASGTGNLSGDGSDFTTDFEGYFKLIAFKSDGDVVVIPSAVQEDSKEYAVDTIGKKLFYKNKTITEVHIGKNVTVIEARAFMKAKKLSKIVIYSDKIEKIKKHAFYGIAKNAVFEIHAGKKRFKEIRKLIKKSGVGKNVTFKRV